VDAEFDLKLIKARLIHEMPEPEIGSDLPVAAVAVIIGPSSRGGAVLLIRRRERGDDPWSGQIAFPGGRKSLADRDLLETAIREAMEEVGVQLKDHELLGHLPIVATRTRPMRVLPVIFQLKSEISIHANTEVTETFWVPISDLEKLEIGNTEVKVGKGSLTVPSYEYEGHVIWGLTFRILNLLINRRTHGDL
jgi:8-oxo-dGTP pyrophosphatase MutT (NUDIX family)